MLGAYRLLKKLRNRRKDRKDRTQASFRPFSNVRVSVPKTELDGLPVIEVAESEELRWP